MPTAPILKFSNVENIMLFFVLTLTQLKHDLITVCIYDNHIEIYSHLD